MPATQAAPSSLALADRLAPASPLRPSPHRWRSSPRILPPRADPRHGPLAHPDTAARAAALRRPVADVPAIQRIASACLPPNTLPITAAKFAHVAVIRASRRFPIAVSE